MMQSNFPLLSLAIWLPIFFGLLVLAVGNDRNPGRARALALLGSIVSFLATLPIISGFDSSFHGMQMVERAPWIGSFNIFYALGIDGISLWFVPLTALITVIVVIAGW